jgi:hypothetical protein
MTSQAQGTVINISGKVIGLIIIVVAASLVSAIVYFQLLNTNNGGNNSVNSKMETLELANEHIWYNQTGWFEAAVIVVNTGEKDAVLTKITVRSVASPWSDIYCWKTDMGPPSAELKQTTTELSSSAFDISIDGIQRTFQQASAEIALKSGWTIALYIRNPGNLTLADAQTSPKATIAVFSESKLYYKEATISGNLTFTFMKTEELKITSMTFGGTSGSANNTIVLSIRNPGTSKVTVSAVSVNDVSKSFSGTAAYDAGVTGSITVYMGSSAWTTGNKYKVTLLSATGTNVAAYETTA